MKKAFILLWIAIVSLIVSCSNQNSTPETARDDTTRPGYKFNAADTAFLAGWKRFDTILPTAKFKFDEPVPRAVADDCIRQYKTIFGGSIPPGMKLIHFVLFDTNELQSWFGGLPTNGESRSIIVEFGIYTESAIRVLNTDSLRSGEFR